MIFLKKFNNIKNIRFEMFKKVFELSFQRKHKIIAAAAFVAVAAAEL